MDLPQKSSIELNLIKIDAESMGWTPLEPGVYLHVGDVNASELLVVGLAPADFQATNFLWVN